MADAIATGTRVTHRGSVLRSSASPVYHAYKTLHIGYVLLPLIAGLDKFFHALADWTVYLAPQIPAALNLSGQDFMLIVGMVEIAAAALVLFAPRIGGLVVAAWLAGIVVNLFLLGNHFDIALRDFGLMLGAFALSRLRAATRDPLPTA